jgi:hypothetical protein
MHTRLDQLLSLRDGAPVALEVREHVRVCTQCARELAMASRLREGLSALPVAPRSGEAAWTAIAGRVASVERRRRRLARLAPLAAAASVAALAMFAALRWTEPGDSTREVALPTAPAARSNVNAELSELQTRSQELEAMLAAFPARPAVERAATSVPIDSLEAQVQWLDHQLTLAGADGHLPQARELWSDRVEVMNSLVQLRYVEAQHVVN